MTSRIQRCVIDARDPRALAAFWREALGWRCTREEPEKAVLEPPAGSPEDGAVPGLLFLRTPDPRIGKNRLHLDLRPDDRDGEVERLLSLGAKRVHVGQPDDAPWTVMADPEGNEFCVLAAVPPAP